jgi:hypothetical protein
VPKSGSKLTALQTLRDQKGMFAKLIDYPQLHCDDRREKPISVSLRSSPLRFCSNHHIGSAPLAVPMDVELPAEQSASGRFPRHADFWAERLHFAVFAVRVSRVTPAATMPDEQVTEQGPLALRYERNQRLFDFLRGRFAC